MPLFLKDTTEFDDQLIYRYTMSADKNRVYGMITIWPGASIKLGSIDASQGLTVGMLGSNQTLSWSRDDQGIVISLPPRDEIRSKWVWTLVFST